MYLFIPEVTYSVLSVGTLSVSSFLCDVFSLHENMVCSVREAWLVGHSNSKGRVGFCEGSIVRTELSLLFNVSIILLLFSSAKWLLFNPVALWLCPPFQPRSVMSLPCRLSASASPSACLLATWWSLSSRTPLWVTRITHPLTHNRLTGFPSTVQSLPLQLYSIKLYNEVKMCRGMESCLLVLWLAHSV